MLLHPHDKDLGGGFMVRRLLPALQRLHDQVFEGFDAVVAVGTSASFAYIVEPLLRVRNSGGFTAQIDPIASELSFLVDVHVTGAAADVLPQLVRHIFGD